MSNLGEDHSYLKFGRAGNVCIECGVDLRTEERHPSTLPPFDEDAEGDEERLPEMRRDDYCSECWEKVREAGYFSFWLTRRRPDARLKRMERRARSARLLDLLDRLDVVHHATSAAGVVPSIEDLENSFAEPVSLDPGDERGNENLGTVLYLTAHMLLHRKVLEWVREENSPDGGEILVFNSKTLGREIRVPDRSPHNPDILPAQEAIEVLLNSE